MLEQEGKQRRCGTHSRTPPCPSTQPPLDPPPPMSTLPRNLTLPLPLRLSSESEIPRSGEDEGRASEVGGVWVPADEGLDVELELGKVKCETKAIPRRQRGFYVSCRPSRVERKGLLN